MNEYHMGPATAALAGARLAEPPPSPRSIGLALEKLGASTENLHLCVTELKSRLEPVLRPEPPAVESNTKQTQDSAGCLLASGIAVQLERVVSIEQIVLNLLDRLEL